MRVYMKLVLIMGLRVVNFLQAMTYCTDKSNTNFLNKLLAIFFFKKVRVIEVLHHSKNCLVTFLAPPLRKLATPEAVLPKPYSSIPGA
jgi:hypothetical protein